MALEAYDLPDPALGWQAHIDHLEELVHEHEYLSARYWGSVRMLFQHDCFALLPEGFGTQEGQAMDLLRLNAQPEADARPRRDHLAVVDCMWALPPALERWADGYLQDMPHDRWHAHSALLQGALSLQPADHTLLLYCYAQQCVILSLQGGSLRFLNSFRIQGEEDLVYYLLFALEELGIPARDAQVMLWRTPDALPDPAPLLRRYVGKVRSGQRPEGLAVPHAFDQTPASSTDFDLLAAALLPFRP